MNKKWITYGLLGVGVAVILWIMTKGDISAFGSKPQTPFLVPQPLPADSTINGHPTPSGTSPNATTPPSTGGNSTSEQPNITGDNQASPNSVALSEQSNIVGVQA